MATPHNAPYKGNQRAAKKSIRTRGSVVWPGIWGTARKVVRADGVFFVGGGREVRI